MKVSRIVASIAILGSASLALTACDPPMPPEVAAAIAEQSYTCVEGNATVSSPELMNDIVVGWADSLSYSCIDDSATTDVVEPSMTFQVASETTATVDAEISEYPAVCSPIQTVPLAVEAGILVYMESDLSSFSVSPKSLAGIMNGTITNWNQLAADNPGTEIPDLPITIVPQADSLALKSLTDYTTAQGNPVTSSVFTAVDHPSLDLYSAMDEVGGYRVPTLQEGQMAIVPNSYAVALGLYAASIYLGMDKEAESPIVATPDLAGLYAASTQWKVEKDANSIHLKLDPSIEAQPAPGFDSAPPPYQAIYPVNYVTCNSSLLPNAIGRFILRLDSQGALGASNYAQLPEYIRIESLTMISKGLPTPKPTATE